MPSRELNHVQEHPLPGDVIEIVERIEPSEDGDEAFDAEIMLRVVAVQEDWIWFKQYGKGHTLATLRKWRERIGAAKGGTVIRGADCMAPPGSKDRELLALVAYMVRDQARKLYDSRLQSDHDEFDRLVGLLNLPADRLFDALDREINGSRARQAT